MKVRTRTFEASIPHVEKSRVKPCEIRDDATGMGINALTCDFVADGEPRHVLLLPSKAGYLETTERDWVIKLIPPSEFELFTGKVDTQNPTSAREKLHGLVYSVYVYYVALHEALHTATKFESRVVDDICGHVSWDISNVLEDFIISMVQAEYYYEDVQGGKETWVEVDWNEAQVVRVNPWPLAPKLHMAKPLGCRLKELRIYPQGASPPWGISVQAVYDITALPSFTQTPTSLVNELLLTSLASYERVALPPKAYKPSLLTLDVVDPISWNNLFKGLKDRGRLDSLHTALAGLGEAILEEKALPRMLENVHKALVGHLTLRLNALAACRAPLLPRAPSA